MGVGHVNISLLNQLPIIKENSMFRLPMHCRVLVLTCLTTYYSELWESVWNKNFKNDEWAKSDRRLSERKFSNLESNWSESFALRTDFERRQALIEIDVLSAMELNIELNQLKLIYRIQFPVMQKYENDTWYDQNGRIVFTNNNSLSGIAFSRKEWNDIKDLPSGTISRTIMDNTMPDGPIERTITYEAPFDRCDREKDYEIVWAEFERRFKEQEGNK